MSSSGERIVPCIGSMEYYSFYKEWAETWYNKARSQTRDKMSNPDTEDRRLYDVFREKCLRKVNEQVPKLTGLRLGWEEGGAKWAKGGILLRGDMF